jgi:hypothetical protein
VEKVPVLRLEARESKKEREDGRLQMAHQFKKTVTAPALAGGRDFLGPSGQDFTRPVLPPHAFSRTVFV